MKKIILNYLKCLTLNVALLFGIGILNAQDIPVDLEKKIDSLFDHYNTGVSPGIVVGIMLDDEVILAKGYGMANLEHKIPISDTTVFNIASVTKQFTAYAIAQLEMKGKLSYDDDVRNFIPELYDFDTTITIDQLIHHTSGLRDYDILRGYIDGRIEAGKTITQQDMMKIIFQQTELNFEPGTDNMYSNTGYLLLALVVERVSGNSFSDWLKMNVFEPLGMQNSTLVDGYGQIIPNRAEPYSVDDDQYFRVEGMLWTDYGASGIYSTIQDLLKWQKYLHQQKYMLRNDPVQSPDYGMGLELNRDSNGDYIEISHNGSVPGYRTTLFYYPKLKLVVVTFANLARSNNYSSIMSIPTFFETEKKDTSIAAVNSIKVSIEYLEQFEGKYSIMGDELEIKLSEGNLIITAPIGDVKLIPTGTSTFKEGNATIIFDPSNSFFTLKSPTGDLKATRIEEENTIKNYNSKLVYFEGKYESPELNINVQVKQVGDELILSTMRDEKFSLKRTGENTFEGAETYYYKKISFETDEAGKINAMRVTDEARWVQNLLFEKKQ